MYVYYISVFPFFKNNTGAWVKACFPPIGWFPFWLPCSNIIILMPRLRQSIRRSIAGLQTLQFCKGHAAIDGVVPKRTNPQDTVRINIISSFISGQRHCKCTEYTCKAEQRKNRLAKTALQIVLYVDICLMHRASFPFTPCHVSQLREWMVGW